MQTMSWISMNNDRSSIESLVLLGSRFAAQHYTQDTESAFQSGRYKSEFLETQNVNYYLQDIIRGSTK